MFLRGFWMIKKIIFKLLYSLLKNLPTIGSINNLRGICLGYFMQGSKKNLCIHRGVNITFPDCISIGNNCVINAEAMLIATPKGKITIGNDVLIAPKCVLQTQNHNYKDKATLIRLQGSSSKPIVLENDVWLGYGVVVLGGVCIAQGSVIGASAVVTKNTSPYSINAGIPARHIGYRK